MKKIPIGILDGGFEGINIFEKLSEKYLNESFIYINDIRNYPYEGKDIKIIIENVKKNVDVLISNNVESIICVSASIIEYCSEYLENYLKEKNIRFVNIVESVIEYVNNNYDQKNMILLAKGYILKANIFQKNFRYNHLYNLPSDALEDIIYSKQTKTSKSFDKVLEVFRNLINKQIDLLIIVDSVLENLHLEIREYSNIANVIDLSELLFKCLLNKGLLTYNKGRGNKLIISYLPKKEFKEKTYWLKSSYKYQNIGSDLVTEQNDEENEQGEDNGNKTREDEETIINNKKQ